MKQPVKSVLLKCYYAISALALHPLFVSHMRDVPFGRKVLHVSVSFVLHEALGLFLTCSLESVCLLRSVSSVPLIFLVINNSSKIRRFTVQMSSKSARRNLAVKTSTVSKTKKSA